MAMKARATWPGGEPGRGWAPWGAGPAAERAGGEGRVAAARGRGGGGRREERGGGRGEEGGGWGVAVCAAQGVLRGRRLGAGPNSSNRTIQGVRGKPFPSRPDRLAG